MLRFRLKKKLYKMYCSNKITTIFAVKKNQPYMKKLIIALLFATPCMAQKILVNEADAATGAKTILTKGIEDTVPKDNESVVNNGLVFFSAGYQDVQAGSKLSGVYFLSLNIVHDDKRVGCLTQEKGKILLTLEDGSQITCSQITPTDCDPVGFNADFVLAEKGAGVGVMKANFEKLQRTKIKRITIITTETAIKYWVIPSKREELTKHFTLVADALKK